MEYLLLKVDWILCLRVTARLETIFRVEPGSGVSMKDNAPHAPGFGGYPLLLLLRNYRKSGRFNN